MISLVQTDCPLYICAPPARRLRENICYEYDFFRYHSVMKCSSYTQAAPSLPPTSQHCARHHMPLSGHVRPSESLSPHVRYSHMGRPIFVRAWRFYPHFSVRLYDTASSICLDPLTGVLTFSFIARIRHAHIHDRTLL